MEKLLEELGEKFSDMNVTVTGICCLGLLDCNSPNAVRTLEDFLSYQDEDEMAQLFGLDNIIEDNEIAYDLIIERRNGWIVLADVAEPFQPSFDKEGKVNGYMIGGVYNMLSSYKDTLEEALSDISSQAEARREDVFNKARKEQGLPLVASESEV